MVMEPYNIPDTTINMKDTSNDITFFNIVNVNPKLVLRLISILFSVVVFAAMSAAGADKKTGACVFHGNADACHYGIAISLIAFVACLFFIGIDLQFNNIWNDVFRRYLVACEFFFSVLWTFLWFVGFCFLADEWRRASIKDQWVTDHARAVLAFSLFSVFSWAALAVMAWARYQHIGALQGEYESLPNQADYNVEYSKDSSKYSIFPEVRAAHEASFLPDQGPQYVVPVPTQGVIKELPRPTPGR